MGVAKYIKNEKDAIEEVIYQSGIRVKPVYTPRDLAEVGFDYEQDLADPGQYPFTRSIHPQGYRTRAWTTRQYTGFGTPQESNNRFKLMISHGQTGLNVAFDLPTQMGYDSDHPMAEGEVGRVGVAIDSLEDMETLFDRIPLDKVSTSMTINSTASTLLSLYAEVGAKQGVASDQLRGTIQNDVLKEYIARGTYIFPPAPSMRIITDIFAYCAEQMTQFNTISISGYHMREAGATAVQEIAFTFANAIEYVQRAVAAGPGLTRLLQLPRWNVEISFRRPAQAYAAQTARPAPGVARPSRGIRPPTASCGQWPASPRDRN